ncbi:hypothetical protein AGOR_G00187410 [Albula goreensis]|uniref:C-type lectin domain-containing protein n=1 Tax=Albula goreensis TaxID=1534307 RepID=A0A8T3D1Z5_9TELE|nr:hypothetical protein AGOR_G00187410 [Albula goreensis]
MEHSVYLLLVLSGLYALCSCLCPRYHFVNELKTWTEAQSYCRENYTDLATIDDLEEVQRMMELVGSSHNHKCAWIGLERGTSWKWQWSLADRDFYSEGSSEFRAWASGEPSDVNENCAHIDAMGQWFDAMCTSQLHFICYDGSANKFVRVSVEKTWREAQTYCRNQHTDLASVRTLTENQEIKNMLTGGEIVWIGLYEDNWKWSDSGSSSFRNWMQAKPDGGDCAALAFDESDRGQWDDRLCGTLLPFFCYSAGATLSWSHPSVSDFLLQQIRRMLIEKGMPEDVDVIWKKQPNGDNFSVKKKKKVKKGDRK